MNCSLATIAPQMGVQCAHAATRTDRRRHLLRSHTRRSARRSGIAVPQAVEDVGRGDFLSSRLFPTQRLHPLVPALARLRSPRLPQRCWPVKKVAHCSPRNVWSLAYAAIEPMQKQRGCRDMGAKRSGGSRRQSRHSERFLVASEAAICSAKCGRSAIVLRRAIRAAGLRSESGHTVIATEAPSLVPTSRGAARNRLCAQVRRD